MVFMDKSGMTVFGIMAAVLHELGHLLTMRMLGYYTPCISFGCVNADIFAQIENFEDSLSILISGPLVNFLISLIFNGTQFFSRSQMLGAIACQNLIMGTLNLLPIGSLDGGQIFFMLLSKKMEAFNVQIIAQIVSTIFVIPILIVGVWALAVSKYNFSLLMLFCYLLSYILFEKDIF